MRKEKVITNYSNLTDYELATLGGRVVQAMQSPQAVDFYSEPQPEIEELEILVEDYVRKHEIASRRGSALEISLKNESRTSLLEALRTLGNYVNEMARGQLSYLLSSGLQLYAPRGSNAIPEVPQHVRLRDGGLSGQLKVSFNRIESAWVYEIQIAPEAPPGDELQWSDPVQTTLSKRGTIIGNLTAGHRYFIRVRAMNGKGTGDWSEPVSTIVR